MNGQQVYAQHPRLVHGAADRIGNIVKFEVKKNPLALGQELAGHCGTLRREDLLAHFEHPHVAMQLLRELQCGAGAWDVQRYD